MKIVYNDIKLDTDELKLLGNGGCEGQAYEYQDKALKVYYDYHEREKTILSYIDLKRLMKLKTNRILLPQDIIHNLERKYSGYYGGYATTLVKNPIPLDKMWESLLYKLEEEQKYIEEDLAILTENKVNLEDMHTQDNFLYNGQMYFIDPGSFKIGRKNDLAQKNQKHLNLALHNHLFMLGKSLEILEQELTRMVKEDRNTPRRIMILIKKIYENVYQYEFLPNYDNYFDYLKDILKEYKTIENYKMQLLSSYIDSEFVIDINLNDELKRILGK